MDLDMGMCEDCGMKPANVQLTQIIGEESTNLHICEECASKRGISISFNLKDKDGNDEFEDNMPFSLSDDDDTPEFEMYDEDFQDDGYEENVEISKPIKLPPPKVEKDIVCDSCGTKLSDFQQSGALGCVGCYNSFEANITNMLHQVHGAIQHKGKNYRDKALKEKDLNTLKSELSSAIQNEEFELAAVIRDKINKQETGR